MIFKHITAFSIKSNRNMNNIFVCNTAVDIQVLTSSFKKKTQHKYSAKQMTKITHGTSNKSNMLQLSFLWSYLYHRLFLPHVHHHVRLYHLLWEHLFLQGALAKISEGVAALLDQCKTAGREFHQAFKIPRLKSTLISPFTNTHNLVLPHYAKLSSANSQIKEAHK